MVGVKWRVEEKLRPKKNARPRDKLCYVQRVALPT